MNKILQQLEINSLCKLSQSNRIKVQSPKISTEDDYKWTELDENDDIKSVLSKCAKLGLIKDIDLQSSSLYELIEVFKILSCAR